MKKFLTMKQEIQTWETKITIMPTKRTEMKKLQE